MGRRTPTPIRHPHIALWYARMPRLHQGEVVGEERRDDLRQEHAGTRMEPSQAGRHGHAAAWPTRL
jgi:hypothetical protein